VTRLLYRVDHRVGFKKIWSKGKIIFTCENVGHVKINYLNLGNRFAKNSQDVEYKIDLVLNQLCIIDRELGKLVGCDKS